MKKNDLRTKDKDVQHEMHVLAIRLLKRGHKQKEVAEMLSVSLFSIARWRKRYNKGGLKALALQKRGRRYGEKRHLTSLQEKSLQKQIVDKCPEQMKLPFVLWTRHAIQLLIKQRYGLDLPIRTVGEYLSRWGFTPQKPVKRAYEQQPEAVQKWLDVTYPRVFAQSQKEDAEIHWCDETGINNEPNVCRGYSRKGVTPVMLTSGKRFSISMISSITNQGQLRYMMYRGGLKIPLFLEFLRRLIKQNKKKVFLILDNLRVHHAIKVREWVSKYSDRIALFFLPPYTPEHNPDEYLNHDLKIAVSKKTRARNADTLKQNVAGHMKRLQRKPTKVKNFFNHEKAIYARAA